ncbi:LysR family transcriptional regulator, partial [Aeromonas media]|uniref:LysR family transcriptional regulator n=1 Tax=Aeromonas media TaxID=651 RepID=UPI003D056BC9
MNIKQLHYFYELAQHRHFAKAAKACFITQPTLSASITALEKSLGTELVVRNSQFVALTQAGEVVLRHAERMLLEQDAMRQELSLFGGALSGTLRIGMVPQSSIDIMPLLKRFNDAFPKVRLRLSVMTHGTLLEQLDLHQTDIGLGFDELLTEHQRRALDVQLRHPNPMALLGPLPPHLSPNQPLRLAGFHDPPPTPPGAPRQVPRPLAGGASPPPPATRAVAGPAPV